MSNSFKIKIFIFFIFLFSYIQNKDLLYEWEDNTQSRRESFFEASPPLSVVVNNKTNSALYLYQDYIYIINDNDKSIIKKIQNPNINSINSPLISYNQAYYICSSSGLYRIENNEINSISIQEEDISGSKNTLKCFYFQNGDRHYILIGIIGSKTLLNYNINQKTWDKSDNEGYLLDINGYSFDSNIPFFATISKDDKDKYNLKIYKYDNIFVSDDIGHLSENSGFKFDSELNIKLSFLNEKLIILFTYTPNKNFNFYHYNIGTKELNLVGGENILIQLKDYNFINGDFIENTPIIYYTITKNNRYYLGAADLEYFIILYNIEIPGNITIFYDQGYFYQSKGFLNYFENNNQKKVCPFITNSNLCQYKFLNKYFVISKEGSPYNLNKNYFSDSCSNGRVLGNYCVEKCPIYSWETDKSCSICNYNYFYYYEGKKCNQDCQSYIENKICYDCQENNKIYYNNKCIKNCSEVYKIYDEKEKTCVPCEDNKYFDTNLNTCIDKCPNNNYETDENNRVCIYCQKLNLYSFKNSENKILCYKKCPFLYFSNNNNFQCEFCPTGYFYKNGECVEDCGEGYSVSSTEINGNKIQYCLSCKDISKVEFERKCYETCSETKSEYVYEENGICVQDCHEGFIANNDTMKCESCLEKGLFYYKQKCLQQCSDIYQFLAWNETHICRECSKDLFFEDNKCVTDCKPTSRKSSNLNICFTCPPQKKYYLTGDCYENCPNNTVINKKDLYCSYCPDDRIFYRNKCIKECKEPYVSATISDRHKICQKCESGYYTLGKCKDQCDYNCYKTEEDKTCHLCFCNNRGICENNSTNECNCDKDYFGKSCEFYRSNKNENLTIISIYNMALKTNASFFTFTFNNEMNFTNYNITWEFFLGLTEVTSLPEYKKYFITGNKEQIFGINPNILSEDKNNYLHLTLITEKNEKFEDEIKIFVQKLEIVSEHKAGLLDEKLQDTDILYAMNTKIEIDQIEYNNLNQYKYYYQFSFLDGNNEEIPLTSFINDATIETYYIPFAKQYLVTLKSDRGELKKYEIEKDDSDIYKNFNNDEFSSKSINEIISDSRYNDIEKLFIFMLIFNSKEKVLKDGELETIINYIDNIFKYFINEKGYYSISNDNNNDYIINYSEPKLLFALINSIILGQKKFFKYNNITLLYNCLYRCVNLIKNINMKLSSKDTISLLRTIEQLHIAYNEYIEKTKLDKNENPLNFTNLFEIITNYLSLHLLPGEGIKIIGNRTILFSYNLGVHQDLIAISSNNLTSPANISNISTYSYENYGLNEDNCGDIKETFLCMNTFLFKRLKQQIISKGQDIKNISLNIYIINNIINNENNQINNGNNKTDNYLVSLKFYDLINEEKINLTIDDRIDDDNNFYFLEFNYKNEKNKVTSNLINDKSDIFYMPYNYSNVTCYPTNHLKSSKYYCLTYFDYLKDVIQCKCNIIDEISIVEDKDLADFYKSFQFQTFHYTYTNKITRQFIILFLIILLIPGLLFLLYDIFKINKYLQKKYIDFKDKRREYYNQVKIYTNAKLAFPIYSTFNKFPYFAAFNATYYTSPKYIKHFIVITAILLGFILNLIPFYFTLPFKEKQILIDKRDIEIDESEIHSIRIIKKYAIRGFIYALISLIFVHFFIKIFNKILKIDEKNLKYWKNVKDIFKDFVYFEIKKQIYLGKNFARIKNRMKAFYAVCGRYLLNKNIMNHPERNKKLENYLKYTGKLSKNNALMISNKIDIKDDIKKKDDKIGTEKESLIYELPDNNNIINEENNLLKKNQYKPPKININIKVNISTDKNKLISSSFGIKQTNKLGDIIKNLKQIKSDNFQFCNIKDNKLGINGNTIQHLEKIKNKYITANKFNVIENEQIKQNKDKESPLSIYYNNNLSIINIGAYQDCGKVNNSEDTKKEFRLLILMTFVLGIIFFSLIILSIIMIEKLMNEYEYFMVKIWLLCTISILLVTYFLIYFIRIIIGSILLFNCYTKRKKGCFIKIMFTIFVDKSLIYMFKIRNYITKYRRDFVNI